VLGSNAASETSNSVRPLDAALHSDFSAIVGELRRTNRLLRALLFGGAVLVFSLAAVAIVLLVARARLLF